MENQKLEIKEFSVKESELLSLVACTENVTKKAGKDEIKKHAKILRGAQIDVEKEGKLLRDGATKFAKWVIGREKELTKIVDPELTRLNALVEEIEKEELFAKRIASLPIRKDRLNAIFGENAIQDVSNVFGDAIKYTDEFILSFNDADFEIHINELIAEKNERTRQDLERREREMKEKEDKAKLEITARRGNMLIPYGFRTVGYNFIIAGKQILLDELATMSEADFTLLLEHAKTVYETEAKEKEDRIRKEEQEKAEKREADRIENERKEKEEAKRKEKEEADKLSREKDYQDFLARNGYTESLKENFFIRKEAGTITLFAKIDTYVLPTD